MRKSLAFIIVMLGVAGFNQSVLAESVAIPVGQQGQMDIKTPPRGLSKNTVEEKFGAPQERQTEVGDPPISRWAYEGFTVYFEHDYVIHSVRHPAK